jgi:hypothetical protein
MTQNFSSDEKMIHEAEGTLRLVAQLPPPRELADRVHHRLAAERANPVRRSFWSLWMPAQRFQFAAAAALALAVAGSTWGVYHSKNGGHPVIPAPQAAPNSGFGTDGAVRVPPTLAPIRVPGGVPAKNSPGPNPAVAKKKPSASRLAMKRAPVTAASQTAPESPAQP